MTHRPESLQYFEFKHLHSGPARPIAELFHTFANDLASELVDKNWDPIPEAVVGLRKLLEARDCFMRAALRKQELARETGLT